MFYEAPDTLVVLLVPTQQMFSGSVVRAVFCEHGTAGIVLIFVLLVLVTRQSRLDPV